MNYANGKIRKYILIVAFIATFLALWLTCKSAKESPIVLIINIFLYVVLFLDIVDTALKASEGKEVAFVRHAIGLLFILPSIIGLVNKDHYSNLGFVGIILFAYDVYTTVFYLATQDYDMFKDKTALPKGFLLAAPPKYILGVICFTFVNNIEYISTSSVHIQKFKPNALDKCETITLCCLVFYIALCVTFIIIDVCMKLYKSKKKDLNTKALELKSFGNDEENENPEEN